MSDHKTDYDYDSGLALEEERPETLLFSIKKKK